MCATAASCRNHCIIKVKVKCEFTSTVCPVIPLIPGIILHAHLSLKATELTAYCSDTKCKKHENAIWVILYVAAFSNYGDIQRKESTAISSARSVFLMGPLSPLHCTCALPTYHQTAGRQNYRIVSERNGAFSSERDRYLPQEMVHTKQWAQKQRLVCIHKHTKKPKMAPNNLFS